MTTVLGLFEEPNHVDSVLAALEKAGFSKSDYKLMKRFNVLGGVDNSPAGQLRHDGLLVAVKTDASNEGTVTDIMVKKEAVEVKCQHDVLPAMAPRAV